MEEIQSKIEDRFGGVYALLDKGVCVYVGQSANVPYRLQTHAKEGKKMFDDFRIYFCKNRKQLESDMIRILRPKYNISEKPYGESYGAAEQTRGCQYEVDRVVDVLRMGHEPIRCGRDDLRRVFSEDYHVKPPYKRILEKYGAYLGEDRNGEEEYDLLMILRFKKQIQQDIFEYALAKTDFLEL